MTIVTGCKAKRALGFLITMPLVMAAGGCSGAGVSGGKLTDAAPGSYEYARMCFRATGLQGIASQGSMVIGEGTMNGVKDKAIAAGLREGKAATEVLTDLLKFTGEGAREYQALSSDDQARFVADNKAFAAECATKA